MSAQQLTNAFFCAEDRVGSGQKWRTTSRPQHVVPGGLKESLSSRLEKAATAAQQGAAVAQSAGLPPPRRSLSAASSAQSVSKMTSAVVSTSSLGPPWGRRESHDAQKAVTTTDARQNKASSAAAAWAGTGPVQGRWVTVAVHRQQCAAGSAGDAAEERPVRAAQAIQGVSRRRRAGVDTPPGLTVVPADASWGAGII